MVLLSPVLCVAHGNNRLEAFALQAFSTADANGTKDFKITKEEFIRWVTSTPPIIAAVCAFG
jgi:hypothetical protein